MGGAAVGAFAVDDHRGGGDEPAYPVAAFEYGFEQRGGAGGVGVDGAADVDHRLAVADHPAEVEDAVDAVECAVDGLAVAQVADEQLGLRVEVSRDAVGVRERVEVVEHAHLLARRQQGVDEVGADEAGAAGDEDACHQTVYSSSSIASAWAASAPSVMPSQREGRVAAAATQARGTRNW